MEGVKDLLEQGDYYSAHQLLLSLAQRHERAGKLEKAASILEGGLQALRAQGGKVPLPTLTDCYRKWMELPRGHVRAEQAGELWAFLVAECERQAEQHPTVADEWFGVGVGLVAGHGLFKELLPGLAQIKLAERLEFLDECCPPAQIPSVYGELSVISANEVEPVCWSVLRNLGGRHFAAASLLLGKLIPALKQQPDQATSSPDDPSGTLPPWLCLFGDASLALVNFCQLLFVLCQRERPPASLLDSLEQHYRKPLARLGREVPRLLTTIRYACFRTNNPNLPPNNPLAAMMQMMNGMGMPGGGRKSGGGGGGGRKNNFDLD